MTNPEETDPLYGDKPGLPDPEETEREALSLTIFNATHDLKLSLGDYDVNPLTEAILAAGFRRLSESGIRPYDEATDHEYGAWETDDLEEHAHDMLAVVRHRRDEANRG